MDLPRATSKRYMPLEVIAQKSYFFIERIKEVKTMKLKRTIWDIREERLLKRLKKKDILYIERDGKYYLPKIGKNIRIGIRFFKPIVLTQPWGFPAKFFNWRGFLKYYEENKVR